MVEDRIEECWNCHGMTSFWVDEDGTPRDVKSIEIETFCARLIEAVEAIPYSFAQYRCWDDHEYSPHGQPHADGSSCPDVDGPMFEAIKRSSVIDVIRRELELAGNPSNQE